VPELHRVSLEQLILRIKTLPHFADMSPHEVLGKLVITSFIIARSDVEGMWHRFLVLVCKTVFSPEFQILSHMSAFQLPLRKFYKAV